MNKVSRTKNCREYENINKEKKEALVMDEKIEGIYEKIGKIRMGIYGLTSNNNNLQESTYELQESIYELEEYISKMRKRLDELEFVVDRIDL